jgi:hypothetical protein
MIVYRGSNLTWATRDRVETGALDLRVHLATFCPRAQTFSPQAILVKLVYSNCDFNCYEWLLLFPFLIKIGQSCDPSIHVTRTFLQLSIHYSFNKNICAPFIIVQYKPFIQRQYAPFTQQFKTMDTPFIQQAYKSVNALIVTQELTILYNHKTIIKARTAVVFPAI